MLVVAMACGSACAGSTPTTPTPPIVTPPTPTTYTITGAVTATNGGQPLSGATVDIGGTTTTTDGAGRYALTLALSLPATPTLLVSGPGLLSHGGYVRGGSSRSVDLDAIRLDGSFDATFYRQFAHNGLEAPAALQPIRHWTEAPKIYIQTIDDAGHPVEPRTLTATVNALTGAIGPFVGGRFGFAAIEQGAASKTEAGWITVRWFVDTAVTYCGRAAVGANPGSIELYYKIPSCSCEGVSQTGQSVVRHELGHALGYWHTDNPTDLMYKTGPVCDRQPSARERAHAGIVYSRPIGNVDPDNDPSSTNAVLARPLMVP